MLYFTSIGFLAQDSNGQALMSHIILCTMQFVEQILLLPTTDDVTLYMYFTQYKINSINSLQHTVTSF